MVYSDPLFAGKVAARQMASLSNCVKQKVGAAIVDKHGVVLGSGNNSGAKTVRTCPREDYLTGEGYHLCKRVCRQHYHAEIDALIQALACNPPSALRGGTCVLSGHTYACADCRVVLAEHGIENVVAGSLVEVALDG